MKKYIVLLLLFLMPGAASLAQNLKIDSLRQALASSTNDSSKFLVLLSLTIQNIGNPDSAFSYGYRAIALARKIKFPDAELRTMHHIIINQMLLGHDSRAFQLALEGIKIAEENNLPAGKARLLMNIGEIYSKGGNYSDALSHYRESKALFDSVQDKSFSILVQSLIGETFALMNKSDSALYHGITALDNAENHNGWSLNLVRKKLGKTYFLIGDTDNALKYFWLKAPMGDSNEENLARVYLKTENLDSSIYYANKAFEIANQRRRYSDIINACILLSDLYEESDTQKSLQYSRMAIAWQDTLSDLALSTALKNFTEFDEQERQYEIEKATTSFQNKVQRLWIFSISGALISAIVLTLVLYRNVKNKKRANTLLKEQKEEVQSTLEKLEATQSQLIQSEKMASLGELTAGIAHEIQNPLNFVNNFSEVNDELLDDLKEAISNNDQEEIEAIYNDLKENESKIKHHGQRAEGIVRGMLQHSRTSTGEKKPTDINILSDEYLRLAYHGMRAKDKSFNAEFKTDFDRDLPKINVVPQDIGRVLLNLINNAFYAVSEKNKTLRFAQSDESSDYTPEVTVTTKATPLPGGAGGGFESVQISVSDNGPGIPDDIKDKIFQPFFTTKPAGSGTGLGLSLSYDIVMAHGGEIKVESKIGKGNEFVISLPIA